MTSPPLRPGLDYYVENGLFVLTEQFLWQRGYCCRNGCRHCPYGYRPPVEPRRPSETGGASGSCDQSGPA